MSLYRLTGVTDTLTAVVERCSGAEVLVAFLFPDGTNDAYVYVPVGLVDDLLARCHQEKLVARPVLRRVTLVRADVDQGRDIAEWETEGGR